MAALTSDPTLTSDLTLASDPTLTSDPEHQSVPFTNPELRDLCEHMNRKHRVRVNIIVTLNL